MARPRGAHRPGRRAALEAAGLRALAGERRPEGGGSGLPGSRPLRRLARNVSWLLLGEAAVKLALLAAALLIGRRLGPAALGSFTLAYGAALLAVVVLCCGQVELLIRETAARPEAARDLLAGALRLQARLAVPYLAVACLGLLAVGEPTLRACLAAFLPYPLLRARMTTIAAPFKGLDRMEVDVQARSLEAVVALGLAALAVLAGAPVWTVGLALTAGTGAALAWLEPRATRLGSRGSNRLLSPHLSEGGAFLALSLVLQLLLRLDVFLLEALGRAREEIGFYSAAGALVWGLLALPQFLALAAYPTLSRAGAAGRRPWRQALLSAAVGAGVGAVLAAGLALAREPLMSRVFGPGFAGAAPLLAALAWALPGASAAMLLGTVLAAWRRQRLSLALQGLALLVLLALDLAWIPGAGASGAARAAVAVQGGLALALLAGLLATRPARSREETAGSAAPTLSA